MLGNKTHQIVVESGCYIGHCDIVNCACITEVKVTLLGKSGYPEHITYLCDKHAETLPIIGMIMAGKENE